MKTHIMQMTFDENSQIHSRKQATDYAINYFHNNAKDYKNKSLEQIEKDLITFVLVKHCNYKNYSLILNLIQALFFYRENNKLFFKWRKPRQPLNKYNELINATGLDNNQIEKLISATNADKLYINSIIGLYNDKLKLEEKNPIKRLNKIQDLHIIYGKGFDYEKIDLLGSQIQNIFLDKVNKGFIECDWL